MADGEKPSHLAARKAARMIWFRETRIDRAAKRYAADLPDALELGWGPLKYYTACQIRTAVTALGLNKDFIALAYAQFLPQERFPEVAEEMRVPMSYDEARAAMARHMR
jgi:hypothetical protein